MSSQAESHTLPVAPENPQIEILPPPPSPPAANGADTDNPPSILQPPKRKVSRNGKIARLPKLERDMVNRMLQNHIPYENIADALNELDLQVTPRNISNWKTRGGYREWCVEQENALRLRLFQDNLVDHVRKQDATQLPEAGLQLAATYLSEFFLKPETRQQFADAPEKFSRLLATLCRISHHVLTLQKYRDVASRNPAAPNPARIKAEDEEAVENIRKLYSSKLGATENEPDIPHRNYLPRE